MRLRFSNPLPHSIHVQRSLRPASIKAALLSAVVSILHLTLSPISVAETTTLEWDPNVESDVAGYRIYYGTESGIYSLKKEVGMANSATISDLAAEQTYYFVVTAYNEANLESLPSAEVSTTTTADNLDPLVSIVSPLDGADYTTSEPVSFVVAASDIDGKISKVEFYNGRILIGVDTDVPFSIESENISPGEYSMHARAFDNDGAYVDSAIVTITVAPPPPPPPPASPSLLAATATSTSTIALSWSDNSSDEDGFTLQRRTGEGNTWIEIASLPADSIAFNDTGLLPDGLMHYRVSAFGSAGESDHSNVAFATTYPLSSISPFIVSETPGKGRLSAGTYLDTRADDDQPQAITEVLSSGRRSTRYSMLTHIWAFKLDARAESTLRGNLYTSGSRDGDSFQFDYSLDGGNSWKPLFTVSNSAPSNVQDALIPSGANAMLVRVEDTNRTPGHKRRDTIFIDQLYVETRIGQPAVPPVKPSELQATALSSAEIALSWKDHSMDETGFQIDRRMDGGQWQALARIPANEPSFSDTSVLPSTAYSYRVCAFNDEGLSGLSNLATTVTPTRINLTGSWHKRKRRVVVVLKWEGLSNEESVDIFRNGEKLTSVEGTNTFRDRTAIRGDFSLTYWICSAGDINNCSNRILLEPMPLSESGSIARLISGGESSEGSTSPSAYTEWMVRHYGELVDDDMDSDRDGATTLTEYVFGSDPNQRTSLPQPDFHMRDGFLQLFPAAAMPSGVTILLETADDLESWRSDQSDPVEEASASGLANSLKWRIASPRGFGYFRFRAERIYDRPAQ